VGSQCGSFAKSESLIDGGGGGSGAFTLPGVWPL